MATHAALTNGRKSLAGDQAGCRWQAWEAASFRGVWSLAQREVPGPGSRAVSLARTSSHKPASAIGQRSLESEPPEAARPE